MKFIQGISARSFHSFRIGICFIFLPVSTLHLFGQQMPPNYFLEMFDVFKHDTLLLSSTQYENNKKINTWNFDTTGLPEFWTHYEYKDSLLTDQQSYNIHDNDSFLISTHSYDQLGNNISSIHYQSDGITSRLLVNREYDSLNRLIVETMFHYNSKKEPFLYWWDSTFYEGMNAIAHRWEVVDPSGTEAIPYVPYDTIYIRKNKRGKVVFYKGVHLVKDLTLGSHHLSLSDETVKNRYVCLSNRISRRESITNNQHIISRWKYYPNGQLKYFTWKEMPDDWESWTKFDKNGIKTEQMRKEKDKIIYHWIYKIRKQ